MTVKETIDTYEEPMLAALSRLVRHNSVRGEEKPGMPFGEGPAAALKEALQIAEEMGFHTVNLDNYCGYAEMGEGKDLIGIAAHLDIVPAGDGWDTDPFVMTRDGDLVYGRGTTDDKGPAVESLFAMKLLRDAGISLNKRVRLIFGCNEETGSLCMAHYNEVEEPLTLGFTPDANFPCIYGEKGHMAMIAKSRDTKILFMKGGFVTNAVCHRCTTVIPADEVCADALRASLAETPLKSFSVTEADGKLTIEAEGVAAHASLPLLGVNAAGCTMQALASAGFKDDFVEFYNAHIGTACDGSGVGLDFKDEYGALTFNNGMVLTENGEIICTIDIRVPVTVRKEQLEEAMAPYLETEQGSFRILHIGDPLFFPPDSPLVKALHRAYVDVTGDTVHQPMVIGGGTYAKALPGIIAFGPEMADKDYRIHNANEFIEVSGMKQAVEIYAKALQNLLEL
ncbi:MAG: M20 family metallopeptidase [Lachnospiraceae bacterium]|nr:M20 family metallopeptidase [Lachnospiraceae bacterium]